jgi:hypothetical protein
MAVIEEVTPVTETLDEQEQQTEQVEQAEVVETETPTEAETVVTIGDEAPKEEVADNATIRQMRQRIRELEKRERELQRQTSPTVQALGKEPTLADFEYDEEKYKPALAAYLTRQAALEAEQERIKQAQIEQQNAFAARLHAYEAQKGALKMPNIEDAEEAVKGALDANQQACIIKYAKNPALVIAALGANPGKLKEFAGKKDLGEFVYALSDVEKMLKVTKKQDIPDPEKRLQAETTSAGTAEGTLERLRAEAEKTGDYSKVMAYKRQKAA